MLKLFLVNAADADTGSLKSLHSFPKGVFVAHAGKIKQNRTTRNLELFGKKSRFLKTTFDALAQF